MFHLERTEITKPILIDTYLTKFVEAMVSYGVPSFNPSEPPWPDGLEAITDKGSLFTRVENWMYTTYNIKLYSTDKSDLSNLLSLAVIKPGITVEMNNDFQWNPGDYGDKKSCFWGGKRQAWAMIYKLGGAAVKLYRGDKGFARCLVLPYGEDNSKPVLFNAYGMNLQSITGLYVLASKGDVESVTPIDWAGLAVDFKTNLPVHINDHGGYVVDVVDPKPTNLSAQAYYMKRYDKYHLFCEKCYHRVSMEPDNTARPHKDYTSVVLCRDCFEKFKANGYTPRYMPANAWYTRHRRIDDAQAEEMAEPKPARRMSARTTGVSTSSSSGFTAFDMPSSRPRSIVETTTPSWTTNRFYDDRLNQQNMVARERVPGLLTAASLWRHVMSHAESYGSDYRGWRPTINEAVALYLLDRMNLEVQFLANAYTHLVYLAANPECLTVAAWFGVVWDGTEAALASAIANDGESFDYYTMAEQFLRKAGMSSLAINGTTLNQELRLVEHVVNGGLNRTISSYNDIMRGDEPMEEEYEGDEEDEG